MNSLEGLSKVILFFSFKYIFFTVLSFASENSLNSKNIWRSSTKSQASNTNNFVYFTGNIRQRLILQEINSSLLQSQCPMTLRETDYLKNLHLQNVILQEQMRWKFVHTCGGLTLPWCQLLFKLLYRSFPQQDRRRRA